MRVQGPLESTDARGAFGPGVVFAKYRGTNYARRRLSTPYRDSHRETLVRSYLAEGAYEWGKLTDSQRSDWEAYALTITRINVFGDPYHVPGNCEFRACYSLTKELGTTPPTDAPLYESPGAIIDLYIRRHIPTNSIIISWLAEQDIDNIEIMLTALRGGGTMSSVSNRIIVQEFVGIDQNFWPGPSLPAGYKFIYKVRGVMDNGQWGPWVQGICPPDYP